MKKECAICLMTDDVVKINDSGVCEFCEMHTRLEKEYGDKGPEYFESKVLTKIKKHKGKYNCLIGISGGFDSAILLDLAVRTWGLKPLVIHFDNHYNTDAANHNIMALVKQNNVDFIRYHVNNKQYNYVCKAFIMAGLPDADIPNDMVMTSLMYEAAKHYGIKYILNGHNFRTEGSTPVKWTYMDAKYIKGVYDSFHPKRKFELPIFTFPEQIMYALRGIEQVRPFYYHNFDFDKAKQRLIRDYGLKDYGSKHAENIYTNFVGSLLLPTKFGIDKRIVYYSALIRSGNITKEEARGKLSETNIDPDVRQLVLDNAHLQVLFPTGSRDLYPKYNFRKYRWLIWLMVKMGVLPYTFYKKYCKQ